MRKAVTLIEVLVASLILLVCVGGTLMMYAPNLKISSSNRYSIQANKLLISELEKIQTIKTSNDLKDYLYYDKDLSKPVSKDSPIKITIDNVDFNIYYTDFSGKPYTEHIVAYEGGNFIKNKESAKLMKLEVNVEWQANGQNFHKKIVTINQSAAL